MVELGSLSEELILEPTLHKPVPMETRVRFSRDFTVDGTDYAYGTVVGIAHLHIVFSYIVLLDEPMEAPEGLMRAVCVIGGLLESEDGSQNWRLEKGVLCHV